MKVSGLHLCTVNATKNIFLKYLVSVCLSEGKGDVQLRSASNFVTLVLSTVQGRCDLFHN